MRIKVSGIRQDIIDLKNQEADSDLAEDLKEAEADLKNGKYILWAEAKKKLDGV